MWHPQLVEKVDTSHSSYVISRNLHRFRCFLLSGELLLPLYSKKIQDCSHFIYLITLKHFFIHAQKTLLRCYFYSLSDFKKDSFGFFSEMSVE